MLICILKKDSPLTQVNSRRISIFEPTIDGHRARYAGEIIRGIRQKYPSCQLRLCIFDSQRQTLGYREFIKPLEHTFEYCCLPELRSEGRFLGEWARLRLLRHTLKRFPCDDLVIPYGDGIVPLMGILPRWVLNKYIPGKPRIESMLFRTEWAYRSPSIIHHFYHRIRRWAICRWPGDRLHLSDKNAWRRSVEGIDRYKPDVSLVPEVFESWHLADRQNALDWLTEQGFLTTEQSLEMLRLQIIGAPGLPSLRKGTVELIQAFCMEEQMPGYLIIWGKIPREVSEQLSRRQVRWQQNPRIIIVEQYVNEDAFRALLSVTDVVALPYQSHLGGTSSLFLLAAIFRLKTICDRRGWLGWAAGHYDHGFAIDSSDVALLNKSLEAILGGGNIPVASQKLSSELRSETMEGGFRAKWC